MRINQDTKISKILNEKPEAISVISAINTNFEKLQNPILRRSLATRVSVKDAAKIGRVDVNVFLKTLEEIGFSVEYSSTNNTNKNDKNATPPGFINKEIVELDIRPILAEGKDPFGYINKVAKSIKPEQILLIINDFEPIRLVEYLITKNFVHWMTQDNEGNYLTYFKLKCKKTGFFQRLFGKKVPCQFHSVAKNENKTQKTETQKIETIENSPEEFEVIQKKYKNNWLEIDVRDLEMPMPMQNILIGIEKLEKNQALFVHHKRIPQFLLPELKKRNFSYVSKTVNADYTYLIVFKND